MGKRSILFYWLLILIPAIIISSATFRLLYHEQERINSLALSAAEERTRTIGETIQVTIEAVEDELTQSLLNIPGDTLHKTLLDWEGNNPLVRNVFIWDEASGLKYPEKGMAATSEERNFVSRFQGLFTGRIPWPSKKSNISSDQPASGSSGLVQDINSLKKGRQELLKIAQNNASKVNTSPESGDQELSKGGWIPWFSENRLYILGWAKQKKNGPVYGVELELMTLLSRLINSFPVIPSVHTAYALVDDSDRVLHQVGDIMIDKKTKPLFTVSLAPHLPHWALAFYTQGDNSPGGSGNVFMIPACLLLIIFIAAIAAGGFLLMRNAKQNMIDAMQKTSFVSNVSHELKTPLTSIRMFAELLLEGRVKAHEKKLKYLQVIVSESRRLTRLVNNVLDFSRLEQGQKKYHIEEINAGVFLKDLAEFHNPRIKDAGMKTILNIPDKEIIIQADRDALEQVVLNLIDNSIKYASSGGEIFLSTKGDGREVEIRIEDRGPGIPDTHRNKIFDKFHRVDDSLTATKQGSGLGLSIAKRMMEDIGGSLSYTPGQGGGSCFVVKLPLKSDF